jgi:hypothetical protein
MCTKPVVIQMYTHTHKHTRTRRHARTRTRTRTHIHTHTHAHVCAVHMHAWACAIVRARTCDVATTCTIHTLYIPATTPHVQYTQHIYLRRRYNMYNTCNIHTCDVATTCTIHATYIPATSLQHPRGRSMASCARAALGRTDPLALRRDRLADCSTADGTGKAYVTRVYYVTRYDT